MGVKAQMAAPFIAAVSMNKEGHPINMRFSVVTGFKIQELTDWAKVPGQAHYKKWTVFGHKIDRQILDANKNRIDERYYQ